MPAAGAGGRHCGVGWGSCCLHFRAWGEMTAGGGGRDWLRVSFSAVGHPPLQVTQLLLK